MYIIESFVKLKQDSLQCCAYLIWTVEKFKKFLIIMGSGTGWFP